MDQLHHVIRFCYSTRFMVRPCSKDSGNHCSNPPAVTQAYFPLWMGVGGGVVQSSSLKMAGGRCNHYCWHWMPSFKILDIKFGHNTHIKKSTYNTHVYSMYLPFVIITLSCRYWESISKWNEAIQLTPEDETLHEMKAQVSYCTVYI